MKRTRLSVITLMILSFFITAPALAQTTNQHQAPPPNNSTTQDQTNYPQGIVVMQTVTIANAKIVSQDKNDVKVSFDLYAGSQVQSDVHYGISLVPTNGTSTYEEVFPDDLTIGAGKSIHEEVTYQAPNFLVGSYQLYVVSKNSQGLLLSQRLAGQVSFSGTGQWIDLENCYLTIQGERPVERYGISQGVDVKPNEILEAHCSATSHMSAPMTLQPSFEVMRRSSYGEKIPTPNSTTGAATLTISPNETKTIDFAIPKATQPQAYDTILTYEDSSNTVISNSVYFHYVISGESATIQGIQLEKNSYLAGDTAQVSFYWTPSADIFSGSRSGGTPVNGAQVKISISDQSGHECGDAVQKTLPEASSLEKIVVPVAITKTCYNPVASAVIVDSKGQILDALSPNGKNNAEAQNQANSALSRKELFSTKNIFIFLILLLIIISIIIIVVRKRNIRTALFIFALLGGMAFFGGVNKARADSIISVPRTCDGPNHCVGPTVYDVYISGNAANYSSNGTPEFNPGEQISASGYTEYNTNCNNGVTTGSALDVTPPASTVIHLYNTINSPAGSNAKGIVTLNNYTSQPITLEYNSDTKITDSSGREYYLYGNNVSGAGDTITIPAATNATTPGQTKVDVIATNSGASYNVTGPDTFTVSQLDSNGNYQLIPNVTAELPSSYQCPIYDGWNLWTFNTCVGAIGGGNNYDYAQGTTQFNVPNTPGNYSVKFIGHLSAINWPYNITESVNVPFAVTPPVTDSIFASADGQNFASSVAITSGNRGVLKWNATNTDGWCYITSDHDSNFDKWVWVGSSGQGQVNTDILTGDNSWTSYWIGCQNTAGTWSGFNSQAASFYVVPVPTVNFSASSDSGKTFAGSVAITSGNGGILKWNATNTDGWCYITSSDNDPNFNKWVGPSGQANTDILTGDNSWTSYWIGCQSATGTWGGFNNQVSFHIFPPPTVNFSASPNPINYGQTSTINWSTTNAVACWSSSSDPNFNNSKGTSGSITTSPLYSNTDYWIDCWNAAANSNTGQEGYTGWKFITVTIQPVNGSCGSANNGAFSSQPTSGLCSSGSAGGFNGSGPWYWTCYGANGGSSVGCGANMIVNGSCNSNTTSSSYVSDTPPASNLLCSTGNPTTPTISSGQWIWSCNGSNGGSNQSCTAGCLGNGTYTNETCSRSDSNNCNLACNVTDTITRQCYAQNSCGAVVPANESVCDKAGIPCGNTTYLTCPSCNSPSSNWKEVAP